jgi:hypothetical protein
MCATFQSGVKRPTIFTHNNNNNNNNNDNNNNDNNRSNEENKIGRGQKVRK